jgi:hypothetical protein
MGTGQGGDGVIVESQDLAKIKQIQTIEKERSAASKASANQIQRGFSSIISDCPRRSMKVHYCKKQEIEEGL